MISLDDVSGVCLPAVSSDSLDILRRLLALKLANRLRSENRKLRRHAEDCGRWLHFIDTFINRIEPIQLARVFDPVPSTLDISIDPDSEDHRTARDRVIASIRYVIGFPHRGVDQAVPIPPTCFKTSGTFYLPHLHLVIQTKTGPVAVIETSSSVAFTWIDGFTLTLPRTNPIEIPHDGNRFWTLPSIYGAPVLNDAPEIANLLADLGLCSNSDIETGMARVVEGLKFLNEVWPSAFQSAVRQLKGLVLLQHRDHTRSHSPLSLLGVIALTAGDPPLVGDLIVHEASHIRLNLMRQFDPLWEDLEPARLHQSPWRPDPRPLLGMVLGIHAFLNVARYWQRVAKWSGGNAGAEQVFERQKQKVRSAWEISKPFVRPTHLGERFFGELEREVLAL
jgi:hypothetical protein